MTSETGGTQLMTAIMLTGGVLRVPESSVLPDGTRVDGTRDIAPDAPDYATWLPYVIPEGAAWHGSTDDESILARWRAAASA
ncbi:hypothetical protein [Nonomuraea diastatica]|uniref:Uncharacterized protein n=1 Tax=Nonomuraea diastatica TaxID=1848329 RepID=A0A4R4X4Q3_9ACTN|nr:hypothetical protein [Nonomuraea diastatica]TDD25308.1 hypothetical protein E1294_03265 [Nonomuraea diastatica]